MIKFLQLLLADDKNLILKLIKKNETLNVCCGELPEVLLIVL